MNQMSVPLPQAPHHPHVIEPAEVPSRSAHGLPCWIVRPETPAPGARPLVAVHGLNRGARTQAGLFGPLAAQLGRTVIAPHFIRDRWPNFQQVVRRGRADLALLDLLDDLRVTGIVGDGPFDLFGYSGGAQFAHRFAMLYPHKVHALSIAAAGWYTFPDNQAFPYGISGTGRHGRWGAALATGLAGFLNLDIRVFVGGNDNTVDDTTRSTDALDAQQGCTRLDRAANWVTAMRAAAHQHGAPGRVSLRVLNGCGHSFEDCVRIGGLDRLVLAGPSAEEI